MVRPLPYKTLTVFAQLGLLAFLGTSAWSGLGTAGEIQLKVKPASEIAKPFMTTVRVAKRIQAKANDQPTRTKATEKRALLLRKSVARIPVVSGPIVQSPVTRGPIALKTVVQTSVEVAPSPVAPLPVAPSPVVSTPIHTAFAADSEPVGMIRLFDQPHSPEAQPTVQKAASWKEDKVAKVADPKDPGMSRLKLPNVLQREGALPKDQFRQKADAMGPTFVMQDRSTEWDLVEFHWQASELWSRPLYFEDVMLERHGHTCNKIIQPALSGTRFYSSVAILPYKMAIDPGHREIYTLGHYRPGSYAPPLLQRPPFRPAAAVAYGGIITGLIFLVP